MKTQNEMWQKYLDDCKKYGKKKTDRKILFELTLLILILIAPMLFAIILIIYYK